MKYTTTKLFFVACLLAANTLNAQTPPRHQKEGEMLSTRSFDSSTDRYSFEYEIINYQFNGDSTILENINLNAVNYFRKPTEDVVITDKNTSLEILIYSMKRIEEGLLERRVHILND